MTTEGSERKGKSMGPGWILVAIIVLVVIYVFWKYGEAETNDYKKFVNKANTLEEVQGNLEKKQKELEDKQKAFEVLQETLNEQAFKIQELEAKRLQFEKEVEDFQEAQRAEIINLKDKIASKQPIIKVMGPIPFEYYTRKQAPKSPHVKPVPAGKTKILSKEEMNKLSPEELAKYKAKYKDHLIKVKKQIEELSK